MQPLHLNKLARLAMVVSCIVMLTACVARQKIALDYQAAPAAAVSQANSVSVQVQEQRPYVLDGDKEPSYIGKYRAGFGNPFDVKTQGEIPLSDVLERDLRAELASKGFATSADESADRDLQVSIIDWNFDAYINGTFNYNLQVSVHADDSLLGEQTFSDSVVIDGSFWTGPKAAFEREMPKIYAEIIRTILQENGQIMHALQADSSN